MLVLLNRLAGLALSAITFWLVARALGPTRFGFLAAMTSALVLLQGLLDVGLTPLLIRRLAKDPDDEAFECALQVRAVCAALSVTAAAATWVFVSGDFRLVIPCLLLYAAIHLVGDTYTARLIARQRTESAAFSQTVERASTAVVVAATLPNLSVTALPVGMLVGAVVSTAYVYSKAGGPKPRFDRLDAGSAIALLRRARPFYVTAVVSQLQNLDSALVAWVAGPAAGGFYSAPSRLTSPLTTIPTAYAFVVFPRVAAAEDGLRARAEAGAAIARITALSALAFAMLALGAGPIISLSLGAEYAPSVRCLQLILLGLVFATANAPMAAVLQAQGGEVPVARTISWGGLLGLPVTGVGAAIWGAPGACIGICSVQIFILLGLLRIWRGPVHVERSTG